MALWLAGTTQRWLWAAYTLTMCVMLYTTDWIIFVVAWELVTILSFLLVSYPDLYNPQAYKAFLVNSFGGAALLSALAVDGSYQKYLILIAILIKSAQWPFHTWIYQISFAPNNLSAYLHAATLVQSGLIFLSKTAPLDLDIALQFTSVMTFLSTCTPLQGKNLIISSTQLFISSALLGYSFHHMPMWDSMAIHMLYKPALFFVSETGAWAMTTTLTSIFMIWKYSTPEHIFSCVAGWRLRDLEMQNEDKVATKLHLNYLAGSLLSRVCKPRYIRNCALVLCGLMPLQNIYVILGALLLSLLPETRFRLPGLPTLPTINFRLGIGGYCGILGGILAACTAQDMYWIISKLAFAAYGPLGNEATLFIPMFASFVTILYFAFCWLVEHLYAHLALFLFRKSKIATYCLLSWIATTLMGLRGSTDLMMTQIAVDSICLFYLIQDKTEIPRGRLWPYTLFASMLTCQLYWISPQPLPFNFNNYDLNSIIADKRALDTLGEICVFFLAGHLITKNITSDPSTPETTNPNEHKFWGMQIWPKLFQSVALCLLFRSELYGGFIAMCANYAQFGLVSLGSAIFAPTGGHSGGFAAGVLLGLAGNRLQISSKALATAVLVGQVTQWSLVGIHGFWSSAWLFEACIAAVVAESVASLIKGSAKNR